MLEFKQRIQQVQHPKAKQLVDIMMAKQTNLCLSADVTRASQLVKLANQLGPKIAVLKTHIDIIEDFSKSLIKKLKAAAKKHNFMIFEDRKFADIGHTVKHQCKGGIYRIADWADFINAHILPGWGIIDGLAQAAPEAGLILIAQLSSEDNFCDPAYQLACVQLAKNYRQHVMGFICQQRLTDDYRYLHMTPGIKLEAGQDDLGQQYKTPEIAMTTDLTDIIIVGRGIINSADPLATAEQYRLRAWHSAIEKTTKDMP